MFQEDEPNFKDITISNWARLFETPRACSAEGEGGKQFAALAKA